MSNCFYENLGILDIILWESRSYGTFCFHSNFLVLLWWYHQVWEKSRFPTWPTLTPKMSSSSSLLVEVEVTASHWVFADTHICAGICSSIFLVFLVWSTWKHGGMKCWTLSQLGINASPGSLLGLWHHLSGGVGGSCKDRNPGSPLGLSFCCHGLRWSPSFCFCFFSP